MGGVLVDEVSLFALFHDDVGIVKFAHHAPGDFLGHFQLHLLRFFHNGNRFRLGGRFGFLGKRGKLNFGLGGYGRTDDILPQDGNNLIHLGGGGNGGFLLGLGSIGNGGGEGFVFFRGHGAEEILLPPSLREVPRRGGGSGGGLGDTPPVSFADSPLREGAGIGFPGYGGRFLELHIGPVGDLIQGTQDAVVDAVKNSLLVEEFYFCLGGMDVYVHHVGRQIQVQNAGGEFAHHNLVPVCFLQGGDQQTGFYRTAIDEEGL